jgi:hypothetical protein
MFIANYKYPDVLMLSQQSPEANIASQGSLLTH